MLTEVSTQLSHGSEICATVEGICGCTLLLQTNCKGVTVTAAKDCEGRRGTVRDSEGL